MDSTLINVIDVWEMNKVPDLKDDFPGNFNIKDAENDTSHFAKFLDFKLRYYKNKGAHLNLALHTFPPNSELTIANEISNRIEDANELQNYMLKHKLDNLVICGQHLHLCVYNRPTGYKAMKKLFPNTKVAITLSRPWPFHPWASIQIPLTDHIYL